MQRFWFCVYLIKLYPLFSVKIHWKWLRLEPKTFWTWKNKNLRSWQCVFWSVQWLGAVLNVLQFPWTRQLPWWILEYPGTQHDQSTALREIINVRDLRIVDSQKWKLISLCRILLRYRLYHTGNGAPFGLNVWYFYERQRKQKAVSESLWQSE